MHFIQCPKTPVYGYIPFMTYSLFHSKKQKRLNSNKQRIVAHSKFSSPYISSGTVGQVGQCDATIGGAGATVGSDAFAPCRLVVVKFIVLGLCTGALRTGHARQQLVHSDSQLGRNLLKPGLSTIRVVIKSDRVGSNLRKCFLFEL